MIDSALRFLLDIKFLPTRFLVITTLEPLFLIILESRLDSLRVSVVDQSVNRLTLLRVSEKLFTRA